MPGVLLRDVTCVATPGKPADADGRVLFSEVALGTVYDSGIGVGLVRGTAPGQAIDELLESQWQLDGSYRLVAVSANVRYACDLTRPVGDRVSDVRIGGKSLRDGRPYRIASLANNFFAKNATPGLTSLFDAPAEPQRLQQW